MKYSTAIIILATGLAGCQTPPPSSKTAASIQDNQTYCYAEGHAYSEGAFLGGKTCKRPASMDVLNPPPLRWE